MKKPLFFFLLVFAITLSSVCFSQPVAVTAGRGEVFLKTDIIGTAGALGSTTSLKDPWEITYGPDDSLWVTEAKGYTVRKINPNTGGMRTVLDLTETSAFTPSSYRRTFTSTQNPWPQGGMMGLAIHPEFMTNPLKKFVYISYVHEYKGTNVTYAGENVIGPLFITYLVRFTYANGQLGSPKIICDTLRGSNDHNSGRLIIAPVNGSYFLFYALGDMGGGQFGNINKANKAQNSKSYEGKILRFNLEEDNDAGAYDKWIPSGSTVDSTNPFNTTSPAFQSAVWSTGIRNNQGFAFANINGTDYLYGQSHGPFSDDELNIIERQKNYGQPLVVGMNDGNYNNARAGQMVYPYPGGTASSLPLIVSENANVNAINAIIPDSYRDPIYCFYPSPAGNTTTPNSIQYIYTNQNNAYNANDVWLSEAISGIGIYTDSRIPDWKNSILFASLKKGRILRMKLNAAGDGMAQTNGLDTVPNFNSHNKFRDVAIDTNGRTMYTCIDQSATTSGPGNSNPIVSDCGGCIQKYSFLGYKANVASPFGSQIPTDLAIAAGTNNTVTLGNPISVTVANANLGYWVPILDNNSNIIAEVKSAAALGTVYGQFYKKTPTGLNREDPFKHIYCDRNITITATTTAASVSIRFYITAAEFTRLVGAVNSVGTPQNISLITDLGVFRNTDNCGPTIIAPASSVATVVKSTFGGNYVIQINNISLTANTKASFYFANATNTTLPVNTLTFTGALNNNAASLKWTVNGEINTANYDVERSINGSSFEKIGTVTASGTTTGTLDYSYMDQEAANQASPVVYYRLRMNDRDGNYAYSNVISISLSSAGSRVTAVPNPAVREVKVLIVAPAEGKATIKIIDNGGRIVLQNIVDVRKGNNTTTINVEKLSAGSYYLNVSGTGIQQQIKLEKL